MSFPALVSQKLCEISIFRNFQFWHIFHRKSAILSSVMIMMSLLGHTWDVGTFLVCMERGDP